MPKTNLVSTLDSDFEKFSVYSTLGIAGQGNLHGLETSGFTQKAKMAF